MTKDICRVVVDTTLRLDREVGELMLPVFLVLVEADHLVEELACHLIEWRHLIGRNCYLNVLEMSNYRLELRVVNSI